MKFGSKLLGRDISTLPMGSWRGGMCRIIEIYPDEAAPEIVMQVRRLCDNEEIGIFAEENVYIT